MSERLLVRRWTLPARTLSLLSYVAVFGAAALPWLEEADHAIPTGGIGLPADEYLIAWILAWVADALRTAPHLLFHAPINHPAPFQLTGTEHLLSFQIVFAPLYWLLDNAILTTNVVLFLTYPAAAFFMQRLLLAMGCSASAAWVSGMTFAVGPLCVPAALHTLQYANLFLPLTAHALLRLRRSPRQANAWAFSLVLSAACLSSYYTAVLVGLSCAVWGVLELLRPGEGRARYAGFALAATGLAGGFVVAVSWPYLTRPESLQTTWESQLAAERLQVMVSQHFATSLPILLSGLAAFGAVGLAIPRENVRICALYGLILVVVAQSFMSGIATTIGGVEIALPYAWLLASPLRFFRVPFRFVVVMGFGTALLTAAALQSLQYLFGRSAGSTLVWGLGIAVFAVRVLQLPGGEPSDVAPQHQRIYALIADVAARQGRGALLELPAGSPSSSPDLLGANAESMLGATRHRLPLVLGHTGYHPPHRAIVDQIVAALPASHALSLLVDATRVRWVLLRPAATWIHPSDRAAWWKLPGVTHVLEADGYDLFRVDRTPRRGWYAAIRRGRIQGMTSLGTPLRVLRPASAVARVRGATRREMAPGTSWIVPVSVLNAGDQVWPAAPSRHSDGRFFVRLVATWRSLALGSISPESSPVRKDTCDLPWDVRPAESVTVGCEVKAPPEPGLYELEIRPRQTDGAAFEHRLNRPLRVRVLVRPRPLEGKPPGPAAVTTSKAGASPSAQ